MKTLKLGIAAKGTYANMGGGCTVKLGSCSTYPMVT